MSQEFFLIFYFHLSFFTDIGDSEDSRRVENIPILPYHFHPFTKIKTFICSYAFEMSASHFQSQRM